MKAKIAGIVLATMMVMGLTSGAALATKPQDVDCDLLAATNVAVDNFLDAEGITFKNYGDVVSSLKDPAILGQYNALILAFSSGQISFDDGSQVVSTNAKCGLVPQAVNSVRD